MRQCPRCATHTAPGSSYCSVCGTPLSAPPPSVPASLTPSAHGPAAVPVAGVLPGAYPSAGGSHMSGGYVPGNRPENPHDTISLVAGVLTFVTGPLSGIVALIFGIRGNNYRRRTGVGGGGSIFGIVMGVLSLLGALGVAILLVLGVSSGIFAELDREIEFELRVEDQIGVSVPELEGATVTCDEVPEELAEGDVVECVASAPAGSEEFSEGESVEIDVLVGEDDELFVEVI